MIVIDRITKSFGPRTLWRDVSFKVARGEMLALVGPSGSGKSTMLNCLGLLEAVDSGGILVDGEDIARFGARRGRVFRRDRLGYLFQNYALIENATVEFNLRVAIAAQVTRPRRADELDRVLTRVGLAGRADEMVYRLSGGEQQRVALARLMVKKPAIVLADEPTGALDQDNADMVLETLRDMAGAGCAVVIATHSTHVIDSCDDQLGL